LSTSALAPGDHAITATYSGDAYCSASTSAALIQAVSRLSTTTVLTSSSNPSVVGHSVTLTATVMATPPGIGTPAGTVQFVIDGGNFGDPVALDANASASLSIDTLSPGSHTVVANYSGDATFAASSGTLAGGQVVSGAEPAGNDTAPPSPSPSGWLTLPTATGATSIHMEAAPASDTGGVEYFFECVDGGGHDSGWQGSPSYDDTDLQPNTAYTYRVQTRDKSAKQNTGDWSTSESATTEALPDSRARGVGAFRCGGIGGLPLAAILGGLGLMGRRRRA
jgi:hypothetical protein